MGYEADCSGPGGDQTYLLSKRDRLVSLDVLKLYRGEDVIRQNPEDIDPDPWLAEGELTELREVPRTEAEERVGGSGNARGRYRALPGDTNNS